MVVKKAEKRKTNIAKTERLQLSLDPLSYRLLGNIAEIGIDGRGHADVASYVISQWLKDNYKVYIEELEGLKALSGVDNDD